VRITIVASRLVSVSIAVLAVAVGCGDQRDPGGSSDEPVSSTELPSGDVLSRPPYMGVSCPIPNSYACDRVGLAVWLEAPASRVEATIAGQELALDDHEWSGPPKDGERQMFAGFLAPAGLIDGPLALTDDDGPGRWIGREPISAPVEFRIVRADGSVIATSVEVELSAGWG
jgi:hypothetical protein